MTTALQLHTLAQHYATIHLYDLFQKNPKRYQQLHLKMDGLVFDFSKQRLNTEVLEKLIDLAKEKKLAKWIGQLFSDTAINHTEQRSAMHWALRMPRLHDPEHPHYVINQQVYEQLDKMERIVDKIRSGQFRGVTGEKITDIVNIGVGGSDLGPLMMCHALAGQATKNNIKVRFVSTMDGSQLDHMLGSLRPASTLFIISSKSFTTIDTLSNALTAKKWLSDSLGSYQSVLDCHFIGISTSSAKMSAWGIASELQLNLWDWVGGRYSLWSAIGLPIAIAIGMPAFYQLLAGAHATDQHFLQTPWHKNIPVLMALIGIWNNNYLNIHTHAILPYDGRLEYLTSYLQQLEMESNGKSIRRDHQAVDYATCPIIWGEVGPNAQHAFYQLLHQGTSIVSTDFIIAKQRYTQDNHQQSPISTLQQQHQLSIANCLAQSRLLAFGNHAVQNADELPVYRQYVGNKPSSTLMIPQLDPYYLGALIAIYEHKVFVQSVMWDINPFDQWGVEMGKTIAQELLPFLHGKQTEIVLDSSTNGLLQELFNLSHE